MVVLGMAYLVIENHVLAEKHSQIRPDWDWTCTLIPTNAASSTATVVGRWQLDQAIKFSMHGLSWKKPLRISSSWVRKNKIIALFVSRRLGEYAYQVVTIPSLSCVTARDPLFKTVRPVDVVNQSFRFCIFMGRFPRCCTLFPSDDCNLKKLWLEQFPNSHTTRVPLWYKIFYFLHVLLWYKHASPVSNAISWYCYSFAILLLLRYSASRRLGLSQLQTLILRSG